MNQIGIMQGRLSPSVFGRLQAFPWNSWKDEFRHARACGFDTIEWLFEADAYEQNPIWTDGGLEKIRQQIAFTGVRVHSLCATYFMAHPFFRVSEKERLQSVEVLHRLIKNAASVGVHVIVLPVLESSEVQTEIEKAQLLDSLSGPLSLAALLGVRLGLETELPAHEYHLLVERARHPALGVCYDIGNASARGYDIAADIRMLRTFLCAIHIKDRKRSGPNVLLGQGDTDFSQFFAAVREVGYAGPLILETAVGEAPIATARAHLKFVKERLAVTEHDNSLVATQIDR